MAQRQPKPMDWLLDGGSDGVARAMRAACVVWLVAVVSVFVMVGPARATSRLAEFLAAVPAGALFPGADGYQAPSGTPPLAIVSGGGQTLGYAFVNADWVDSTGYSGKPIQILIGLASDGRITGARLMDHHEPIVLVGIPPARIADFIVGYVGRNVLDIARAGPAGRPAVDIVSGATVTVTVIAESMMRAAIKVARAEGMAGPVAAAGAPRLVDPLRAAPADWKGLLAEGAVRHLALTVGQVTDAFHRAGNDAAAGAVESANPSHPFIDLYVAPVSVPGIGRALLGASGYEDLRRGLKPGEQALLIAGDGPYSFKGSAYVRGGIFDRIAVLQGDADFRFRDRNHSRLGGIATRGAPDLRDVDLFTVPADNKLDIAAPWRLQLLAERAWGAREKAFLTFELDYRLPASYLKPAAAVASIPADDDTTPLWHTMWRAKQGQIGVLLVALGVLTLIFFFQDYLVKRPVLYDRVRLSFLLFALLWIGWYAQAQLSVVNVLAFLSSVRGDFRWDYFLMAPLIFILWFATAASLLFWNRGAFCGWLCPFGALQELLNRAARRVGIPQFRVPFAAHQRLVAIKYIVFLVLFGLSLDALSTAEKAAEVEPFKTAIILHFARAWPFSLYAAALLAANLVVERFFCRYLCPLGAALAIPARLRMFDWLRRYPECGTPCQRCNNDCPVQAIHPEGHINPNECIQCLHCQMLYHHDHKCPVMIQRRLKREKYQASASPPPALLPGLPPRQKISASTAGEMP